MLESLVTLFRRSVRDCMDTDLPVTTADTTCREVARLLRDYSVPAVAVRDENGRLTSLVTEGDIAREALLPARPTLPVSELVDGEPLVVKVDDPLFQAVAALRRRAVEQAIVVDGNGNPVGLLRLSAALAGAMPDLLGLCDRLTHEETVEGLRQVKAAQVELSETLFASRAPATEIQTLISGINNDLHRRVVDRAARDMAAQGWGPPPVEFDVIVMGSGGRGESFLFPDQDNGFVIGGYAPASRSAVDAYFIELAQRMTRELDKVGFPLCRGHVMATNPLWRKRLDEWCRQVDLWLRRPHGPMLRLADIFFDFRPVRGPGKLAGQLRDYVAERVPRHRGFLQAMEAEQKTHGVALSPFGRLQPDRQSGRDEDRLNLKHHALLPLVEAVRLLALEHGVRDTSTLARLGTLEKLGVIDGKEHDDLSLAFSRAVAIVLRQQLSDYRAGRSVNAYVPPHSLTERERRELVGHLKAIRRLKERVGARFSAELA
jgi:CBS domain-containing protein